MAEATSNFNEKTLALVKEFREKLLKDGPITPMETLDIEVVIGQIRRRTLDERVWRDFSDRNESDKTFRWRLMAYADDPKDVEKIAKHMKKENRPPTKTSLASIIEPLDSLNKTSKDFCLKDFLRNLRDIDEDRFARADRMFYAYIKQLLGASSSYTLYEAHEQLQAIRMLRFETDDEEELKTFARKNKNFNDAHDYLQSLIRKRLDQDDRRYGKRLTVTSVSQDDEDGNSQDSDRPNESYQPSDTRFPRDPNRIARF